MAPFLKYVIAPYVTRSNHNFDGALAVVLTLEHSARVWTLGALLDHRDELAAGVTPNAVLFCPRLMVPTTVGDPANTAARSNGDHRCRCRSLRRQRTGENLRRIQLRAGLQM